MACTVLHISLRLYAVLFTLFVDCFATSGYEINPWGPTLQRKTQTVTLPLHECLYPCGVVCCLIIIHSDLIVVLVKP